MLVHIYVQEAKGKSESVGVLIHKEFRSIPKFLVATETTTFCWAMSCQHTKDDELPQPLSSGGGIQLLLQSDSIPIWQGYYAKEYIKSV